MLTCGHNAVVEFDWTEVSFIESEELQRKQGTQSTSLPGSGTSCTWRASAVIFSTSAFRTCLVEQHAKESQKVALKQTRKRKHCFEGLQSVEHSQHSDRSSATFKAVEDITGCIVLCIVHLRDISSFFLPVLEEVVIGNENVVDPLWLNNCS